MPGGCQAGRDSSSYRTWYPRWLGGLATPANDFDIESLSASHFGFGLCVTLGYAGIRSLGASSPSHPVSCLESFMKAGWPTRCFERLGCATTRRCRRHGSLSPLLFLRHPDIPNEVWFTPPALRPPFSQSAPFSTSLPAATSTAINREGLNQPVKCAKCVSHTRLFVCATCILQWIASRVPMEENEPRLTGIGSPRCPPCELFHGPSHFSS